MSLLIPSAGILCVDQVVEMLINRWTIGIISCAGGQVIDLWDTSGSMFMSFGSYNGQTSHWGLSTGTSVLLCQMFPFYNVQVVKKVILNKNKVLFLFVVQVYTVDDCKTIIGIENAT